jgi:hypothetical protein
MILVDVTGKSAVMPLRYQQAQAEIVQQPLDGPFPGPFLRFDLEQFPHKGDIGFGHGQGVENLATQAQILGRYLAGTAVQRRPTLADGCLFLSQFIFGNLGLAQLLGGRGCLLFQASGQLVRLLPVGGKRGLILTGGRFKARAIWSYWRRYPLCAAGPGASVAMACSSSRRRRPVSSLLMAILRSVS